MFATLRKLSCKPIGGLLGLLLVSLPYSSAWSYDNLGGYSAYIISPQVCKARYESQDRYLIRSGNAQIRNNRDRGLQVVCPIQRQWFHDNNGDCNTSFTAHVSFRLRPRTSVLPMVVRLSLANRTDGVVPGAFKEDRVINVSDLTWDGSSTYTSTHNMSVSMACEQTDSTSATINLNSSLWVPTVILTMPPGSMLRSIGYSGGQNAP